jgi:hypothetical protein
MVPDGIEGEADPFGQLLGPKPLRQLELHQYGVA